jgi:hypothetical protein
VTWPCFRTLDNAIRDVRDRATTETDGENVDTVELLGLGWSLLKEQKLDQSRRLEDCEPSAS